MGRWWDKKNPIQEESGKVLKVQLHKSCLPQCIETSTAVDTRMDMELVSLWNPIHSLQCQWKHVNDSESKRHRVLAQLSLCCKKNFCNILFYSRVFLLCFFFFFFHVLGHISVTNEDFFTKFGIQVEYKTIFCRFNIKVKGQRSKVKVTRLFLAISL